MSIITSGAYALQLAQTGLGQRPVIGWKTLVTPANVTCSEQLDSWPGSNLGNPATNQLWISGDDSAQTIRTLFSVPQEVDYAGLAKHNFGKGLGVGTTVQGLPTGGDPNEPTDWIDLVDEAIPADEAATMWRWEPQVLIGVQLKLAPNGGIEPEAGAFYVGKLLVMLHGVQTGFTPITMGARRNVITPKSQNGHFLGRILTGGSRQSEAKFVLLDPEWTRGPLKEWLDVAMDGPFFWAWSPADRPSEVGYAWLTTDATPVINVLTGYLDLQLQMEGLL